MNKIAILCLLYVLCSTISFVKSLKPLNLNRRLRLSYLNLGKCVNQFDQCHKVKRCPTNQMKHKKKISLFKYRVCNRCHYDFCNCQVTAKKMKKLNMDNCRKNYYIRKRTCRSGEYCIKNAYVRLQTCLKWIVMPSNYMDLLHSKQNNRACDYIE